MNHLTKLADELLAGGFVNAAERSALISAGAASYVGGDEEQAPVGGTVPATLALTLGTPAKLRRRSRPASPRSTRRATTANVISTAGDAALSVVASPGHLMNGTFALPEALRVDIAPATWTAPVSNDGGDDHVPASTSGRPTRCGPAPTPRR